MIDTPQVFGRRKRATAALSWMPVASWMAAAFAIAAISAFVVFLCFGLGVRGTAIALRVTARWSFLLFFISYCGPAIAALFSPRFSALARLGRDFGLAFASAQLIHVGLVAWLIYLSPNPAGGMLFFWVGILCTYLLALLSLPQFHRVLNPSLWRVLRTASMEYIALAFATDFILGPLQRSGFETLILPTYLPFALLLIGGMEFRMAANIRRHVGSRLSFIASSQEITENQPVG
jgi:hypothetical protein